MEKYSQRHGFTETQSLSWDNYRSHSTLHQISMVFLTAVWSNWLLFFGSETIFDAFRHFEKSCDNIAQLDWLIFLPTPRRKARKSRERADLVNSGEFNRRYLTCQIWAILYPDSGDWRKSQSPHLVIASSVAKSLAKKFVVLVENQRQLCLQRNKNGRPLEIKRKTSLKGC